jgi:arsenate reductase-like glutaredoxin family protein
MNTPIKEGKLNTDAIEKWLNQLDKELEALAQTQAAELEALEPKPDEIDEEEE